MLNANKAIKLFIRCAFVAGRSLKGFKEVLHNIVSKFGGHPSALISMGSFLQGNDMSEWMSISAKLEGIGAYALIEKFKDSDDGQEEDKSVPVIMAGDQYAWFIAMSCPCEPPRQGKIVVEEAVHTPTKQPSHIAISID
ncbi:TMV resistance protein N-like protein [Tanacetum coccineum]